MNGSSSIRLSLGQIQLLKSLPINFSVHDTPCPTNQDIYIPHQDPPPLRFAKGDELRVETLVSLARSSPLLTGLSFRAVHWTPLKSAPVPLREGREFVGGGGTALPTKKLPQTHETAGQTRLAKPHHLMKCAQMGAFRGAWGDWSPHKKTKGRGGTGPPTKKQRGVGGLVPPQKKKRGAYSPQANSALCGAYPPEADSPRPRRNGIRSR